MSKNGEFHVIGIYVYGDYFLLIERFLLEYLHILLNGKLSYIFIGYLLYIIHMNVLYSNMLHSYRGEGRK